MFCRVLEDTVQSPSLRCLLFSSLPLIHPNRLQRSKVSSENSCLIICISGSGVSGLKRQAISLPVERSLRSKSTPDFPFSAPQSLSTQWLKKLCSQTLYTIVQKLRMSTIFSNVLKKKHFFKHYQVLFVKCHFYVY